uniref:Uncharacterized protein n=1 Tax=Arundo donax TaxID=35708 RepID=A0A0A9ADQ6_ARUDO
MQIKEEMQNTTNMHELKCCLTQVHNPRADTSQTGTTIQLNVTLGSISAD